jgi:hypothetical protein
VGQTIDFCRLPIPEERKRYSCAGICVSVSRQALSLRRRQTQHKPSVELGAHGSAHTTQGFGFSTRPASSIFRASSIKASGIKFCGAMALGMVASADASGASGRLRFTTPL